MVKNHPRNKQPVKLMIIVPKGNLSDNTGIHSPA